MGTSAKTYYSAHAWECQVLPTKEAFCRWLEGLGADWFATFTLAEPSGDYRVTRLLRRWHNRVTQLWGPCAMVYVIEPGRLNPDSHHAHALVKFGPYLISPHRKTAEKLWEWGWAAIFPVREGAGKYVAKYIAHKRVPDWGILGNVSLLRS